MYVKLEDKEKACPCPPVFSQGCDSIVVKGWGYAKDVIWKELREFLNLPRRVPREFCSASRWPLMLRT